MNYLFSIFLVLCSASIILATHRLIESNSKNKATFGDMSSIISALSNREKARYMINLLDKGYVLRHILTNNAPRHNDERYKKSYLTFLNEEIISNIKKIRGDRTYE